MKSDEVELEAMLRSIMRDVEASVPLEELRNDLVMLVCRLRRSHSRQADSSILLSIARESPGVGADLVAFAMYWNPMSEVSSQLTNREWDSLHLRNAGSQIRRAFDDESWRPLWGENWSEIRCGEVPVLPQEMIARESPE